MRALTLYEQIEHDQPGTPARAITHAHRGDLAALLADIRAAREQADLVFVSVHWGIHMVEGVIADYQREVAHAAVEAGAHTILGHHPHLKVDSIAARRSSASAISRSNGYTRIRRSPSKASITR
jgi:poly-gamma-glutamate synthesis protein (capsule biosynthesis protein)